MMSPGDEKVVADRLVEVLSAQHRLQPPPAPLPASANLTGRWEVEIQYAAGKSTHTLYLNHQGNLVEGTHQGDFLARDLSGTMSGDEVRFSSVQTERHGDALSYRFSGKISGEGMSGDLDMGEYLGATWSARRRGYGRQG
jgi:L-seryl-tRNA(Ser) seleniumtransferase